MDEMLDTECVSLPEPEPEPCLFSSASMSSGPCLPSFSSMSSLSSEDAEDFVKETKVLVETTVSGGSKRKLDKTDSANKSVALRRYDLPPGFQAFKKRIKKRYFNTTTNKRYVSLDGKMFTSVQACWDYYEASITQDSQDSQDSEDEDSLEVRCRRRLKERFPSLPPPHPRSPSPCKSTSLSDRYCRV